MKHVAILVLVFAIGCGTAPQDAAPAVADTQAQPTVAMGGSDKAGQKGDKGDPGAKGDKGDTGMAGESVAGADGKDGAAGEAGAVGEPGADGADGANAMFDVLDGSGVVLGKLAWVDPATSYYYVNRGNMRLQFARDNGHFPNAYMFCTGLGCTGTCRLAIANGVYANVFEVYIDGVQQGAILQATGARQVAGFAYASRRMGGSCTNTAGSVANTYGYAELALPDLGFAYPVSNAEVANTGGGL